jgi:tagatose 6-phosphate kinase
MILTVTPNPAWDVTYAIGHLRPGESHRAREVHGRAGGKGVNVARVAAALGHEVLALAPLGGHQGRLFAEELDQAGIPYEGVPIAAETRRTTAIESAEGATLVNEPGPECDEEETAALRAAVERRCPDADVVVCSGSLPRGAPDGLHAELVRAAARHGVPAVVDTSGPALRAALAAGPRAVKPNSAELAEATGSPDPAAGAQELRARGASTVAVSLGAQGMLALAEDGAWRVRPDRELAGNAIGAGDAAVAALAAGIAAGHPWPRILLDAVALSSAAVLGARAGDFDAEHYERSRKSLTAHAVGHGRTG